MLTELGVLQDVLNIAKEKRYMVIDPVSVDPPDPKPIVVLLQKKKVCSLMLLQILNFYIMTLDSSFF